MIAVIRKTPRFGFVSGVKGCGLDCVSLCAAELMFTVLQPSFGHMSSILKMVQGVCIIASQSLKAIIISIRYIYSFNRVSPQSAAMILHDSILIMYAMYANSIYIKFTIT